MVRNARRRQPGDTAVHRAKRGKNLALLAVLLAFIVIVYLVAIIRMGS